MSEDTRALWRDEERKKKTAALEAQEAADAGVYSDVAAGEDDALKTDWQRLIALARVRFPAHLAKRYSLSPRQRVASIAYISGWGINRIATAAGVHRNTVNTWLKDETVTEFMRAFEYHMGTRDAKEILDKEMFATLKTMIDIRDDPMSSASTKLDAAKWLWEQKYGKAKELKEIKGTNLRELTEQLMKATTADDAAAILDNVNLDD